VSSVQLYHGDCAQVMHRIPDVSVPLVVTSPPYDKLRKYDTFDFEAVAAQLVRVLAQGGVIVWVVADQTINGSETGTSFRQVLHLMSLGLNLHDTMIFAKKNPPPLNHNRYEQAFEYMFVLSKGKPRAVHKLVEPCLGAGKVLVHATRRHNLNDLTPQHGNGKPNKETKPRTNIWHYAIGVERVGHHPAPFPLQLAIDHILSWSNEGDTVLDPFFGSATTGVACVKTDRNFIGIEKDATYFCGGKQRIEAAQLAARQLEFTA
jgi:DNA modification methylase